MQSFELIETKPGARAFSDDLYQMRENARIKLDEPDPPRVTIAVLACNCLSKAKYCVECVLEYTKQIPFELILIDNGSDDGTLEFFQSVDYPDKRVVRVAQNAGAMFGYSVAFSRFRGDYLVTLNQDVYVTEGWLEILLGCMESDHRIGMASPMSSNVSNLQRVDLGFSTMEEMQQAAKQFNRPNPALWKERLRLITPAVIYRKELLKIIGEWDTGFWHNFSDDDLSFRIRRAGYKLILCGDVFVHHDHPYHEMGQEEAVQFQESLDDGRRRFLQKYHGLDAWDDVCNFETLLIDMLPMRKSPAAKTVLLGVDVRCGTPLLELKNKLREQGVLQTELYAYTAEAKYYEDLAGFCEKVFCGPVERISDRMGANRFDCLICGEPVNLYAEPLRLLRELISFLGPGGSLLCKWRNGYDYRMLEAFWGIESRPDGDMPLIVPIGQVEKWLRSQAGVRQVSIRMEGAFPQDGRFERIQQAVARTQPAIGVDAVMAQLFAKDYLLCIQK